MHNRSAPTQHKGTLLPRGLDRGFTIIEILVVVIIVGLASFPLLWSYQRSRQNQLLTTSADRLAAVLRQAHIFSREAKDERTWGVAKVSPTSFALVSTPGTPGTEKTYTLPPEIEFLTDFTVWFVRGTGSASPTTISLVNRSGNQTDVIISDTGVVEVNAR